MAAHACLKNVFMEDWKCHNLIRWLKWINFQEVRNYPIVLDDLEEKLMISTAELKDLKAMSVKAIKSSEEARVC